uniref:RNA dependent RNA polymerase n=1 Tax=Botrytis cinerea negative-stranded RNA virus 12 TaxID=2921227 RepID=A0AA51RGM7_9VIRU|nr:RNA dependent RNA polymerase [Botrytis cinerea negative stranded RNA virus 12]
MNDAWNNLHSDDGVDPLIIHTLLEALANFSKKIITNHMVNNFINSEDLDSRLHLYVQGRYKFVQSQNVNNSVDFRETFKGNYFFIRKDLTAIYPCSYSYVTFKNYSMMVINDTPLVDVRFNFMNDMLKSIKDLNQSDLDFDDNYFSAWEDFLKNNERRELIEYNNKMIAEECNKRQVKQVPGDGLCGVHAVKVILGDNDVSIEFDDLYHIFTDLEQGRKDWFNVETLHSACEMFGINLLCFHQIENRLIIGKFKPTEQYSIILCDGFHYTPLCKQLEEDFALKTFNEFDTLEESDKITEDHSDVIETEDKTIQDSEIIENNRDETINYGVFEIVKLDLNLLKAYKSIDIDSNSDDFIHSVNAILQDRGINTNYNDLIDEFSGCVSLQDTFLSISKCFNYYDLNAIIFSKSFIIIHGSLGENNVYIQLSGNKFIPYIKIFSDFEFYDVKINSLVSDIEIFDDGPKSVCNCGLDTKESCTNCNFNFCENCSEWKAEYEYCEHIINSLKEDQSDVKDTMDELPDDDDLLDFSKDDTEIEHNFTNCICKTHIKNEDGVISESIELACGYKDYLYSINLNISNFKCFCEMISCLGYFLYNHKNEYYSSNDTDFKARFLYCLDSFLKLRHDIVNAIFLLEFEEQTNLHTDKQFSQVFDFMSSLKTPDNIFVQGSNVLIVETQVSNNLDKTVFQKGTTNEDSRYKNEISEIIMHGYNVVYKVLFLNSKDYMNNMHASVNEMSKIKDSKRNIYEILLNNLREYMPSMDFNDDITHLVVGTNFVREFNDQIQTTAKEMLNEVFKEGLKITTNRPNTVVSVNSSFLKMLKIHKKQLMNRLDSRLFEKVILIQRNNKISVIKDKDAGVSNKILLNCLITDKFLTVFNFSFIQSGKSDILTKVTDMRPYTFYEESKTINPINFISYHKTKNLLSYKKLDLDLYKALQKNRIVYDLELGDFPRLDYTRNNSKKMMVNKVCDSESLLNFNEKLIACDSQEDMKIQSIHYKQFTTMPIVNESALIPAKEKSFSGFIDQNLFNSIISQSDPTTVKLLNLWGNVFKKQGVKKELPIGLQEAIQKNRDEIRYYLLKNHNLDEAYKTEEYFNLMKRQKDIANDIRNYNKFNSSSRSDQNVLVVRNQNDVNEICSNDWRDKTKGSITRGADIKDYNQCSNLVKETTSYFLNKTDVKEIKHIDQIMNLGVDDISMTKLKENMMQFHKEAFLEYKQTKLCYLAEFVSSLCYNLTYMSQTTYRSNMFQFSNLNNLNTLLVVRGGTNIHKNKTSRQFRLIYPVPDFFRKYTAILGDSYQFINHDQNLYCITPWSILHESVLTDNMFFNYKMCSLYCNYFTRKSAEISKDMYSAMMPVLLSFNNRRSTESNLGNIRYPLVNVLGTHSSLIDLAEDMSHIPKDALQLYLRECFKENFLVYTKEINDFIDRGFKGSITNPINKHAKIDCQTDFIYVIYCTYSMTKAPYNQQVEQSINMSSVMKVHEDYDKKMGMANTFAGVMNKLKSTPENEIYNNEFYFDPLHAFEIGKYANNYLKSKSLIPAISMEWSKTMTSSWTDIITEAGMRSDNLSKGEDSFFGRKGYEVVMQELLKDIENEEIVKKIKDIMTSENTDIKKSQLIRDLNKDNLAKINEYSDFLLMFHEVDKVQWKGGRQIYVMTMKTKLLLQPLEKLMAFLCKKVENELISIPSSKRLSRIHRELFPKQSLTHASTSYYLTLDCSKWGPKAMFLKYLYMVLGMSEILPESFITLMLYVTKIYFDKEVVVSKGAWKIFKNNEKNKDFVNKYFIPVEELETAKFKMPYSFVMGIFNYMSSFMHAINQLKTCSEICDKVYSIYGVQMSFDMKAHSDDSAGRLQIETIDDSALMDKVLNFSLTYYENSLRSVNHLLSVKKSVVSKSYLELLSILYVKRRLLSLTPKFFSNMSFKPTLEGYSSDVSQGYGKAIELISMGGVFSESFFNMRCYSSMVNRFYHIDESSTRPVSAFGGLFSHPALVLLTGGMSDNIRLFKHNEKDWFYYNSAVHMMSDGKYDFIKNSGFSPINPLYNKPSIKLHSEKIVKLFGDLSEHEILKNTKLNNSSLYPIFYNNLLKNLEFRASISYTSNTRRVLRCMISSTATCIKTSLGLFKIKDIIALLESLKLSEARSINIEIFEMMKNKMKDSYDKVNIIMSAALGEGTAIYDYLSNNLAEEIRVSPSNHTCKPCNIDMNLRNHLFDFKGNLELTYFSDNKDYFLTGSNVNLVSNKINIKNNIKKYMKMSEEEISNLDFKNFIQYARFLNKINVVNLNFYSYTSTRVRSIKNYMDIMVLIQDNSCYMKQFSKIYSDYKNTNIKKSFRGLLTVKQIEELTFAKELITLKHSLDVEELHSVFHKKTMRNVKEYYDSFILDNDKKYNRYLSTDLKLLYLKEVNKGIDGDTVLPFCFTWLKEQFKQGGNWVGEGKLLFKIRSNELLLNIDYGVITSAMLYSIEDDLTIEDWENILATCEMLDLNLRYSSKADFTSGFSYLGFNKDDLDNIICDKLEIIDTVLFPVYNSFNSLGFPSKGDVEYVKAGVYEISSRRIETIVNLLNISIKNMANNFYTDKQEIKDIMLNNLMNVNAELSMKKSDIVDNFSSSEIYNCYVYNGLNTTNYKLKSALKKYCITNRLDYKPVESLTVTQLVNYGVNPDQIPDDIMDLYLEKLFSGGRDFNYNSFLNEVAEFIKNNKDWDSFLSKWLAGKEHQAIAVSRRNLMEVLENPLNFIRLYTGYSQGMEASITNCLNKLFKHDTAFFNFLNGTPILWDEKKLKEFLSKLKLDINLGCNKSSNFKKIYLFFKHIFSNSYVYKKFDEMVSEDKILSKIPLNPNLFEEWCRLYVLLCKGGDESEKFYTKKDLMRESINNDLRIKDVTFRDLDIVPTFFELETKFKNKRYKLVASDKDILQRNDNMYFPNYITRRPIDLPASVENGFDFEDFFGEIKYEDSDEWNDIVSGYLDTMIFKRNYIGKFKFNQDSNEHILDIPSTSIYGPWSLNNFFECCLIASNSYPSDFREYKKRNLVSVYKNFYSKSIVESYIFVLYPPDDFNLKNMGLEEINDQKFFEVSSHEYNFLNFIRTEDGFKFYYDMENIYNDFSSLQILKEKINDSSEEAPVIHEFNDIVDLPEFYKNFNINNSYSEQTVYKLKKYNLDLKKVDLVKQTDVENIGEYMLMSHCMSNTTNKLATSISLSLRSIQMNIDKDIIRKKDRLRFSNADFEDYKPIKRTTILNQELETVFGKQFTNDILNGSIRLTSANSNMFINLFEKVVEQLPQDSPEYLSRLSFLDLLIEFSENCNIIESEESSDDSGYQALYDIYKYVFDKFELRPIKRRSRKIYSDKFDSLHTKNLFSKP